MAVTFCTDAADGSTDVFRPEECLSFAEALWMYTVGGAFAGNCEGSLGRIENGTAADFVVVDPSIIHATEVAASKKLLRGYAPDVVVVGGEIVHTSTTSPVFITIGVDKALHRGLQAVSVAESNVAMGGPYVPGKNGSFRRNPPKKRSPETGQPILCQRILPAGQTTMFSNRPSGSCVCILTGGLLGHDTNSCGIELRSNEMHSK